MRKCRYRVKATQAGGYLWTDMAVQARRETKKVITCINRRASPIQLTPEDFDIQQSRVPRRARFLYMLSDTADAEIMFAWVDAGSDAAGDIDARGGGSSST